MIQGSQAATADPQATELTAPDKGLARLEAAEAIRNLKARYAMYADAKTTDGHRKKAPDEVDRVARLQAGCFTEDAEWFAGEFGTLNGREALFENFRSKPWRFAMHHFVNPIIEIHDDGCTASGQWTMWFIGTEESSGACVHISGYTLDEYQLVDGEWLFSKVTLRQKFMAQFNQPWTVESGPAAFVLGA